MPATTALALHTPKHRTPIAERHPVFLHSEPHDTILASEKPQGGAERAPRPVRTRKNYPGESSAPAAKICCAAWMARCALSSLISSCWR